MSQKTNIEWATSTGNPWIGCTKVSPGCKNCYAATMDETKFSRTLGNGTKDKPESHWGKGAPRVRTKAFWKDAIKWNREAGLLAAQAAAEVYDEGGTDYQRPRIFPSLCDWLDEEVPIEWLADFLRLIHDTPNLDWLLLTKRPDNFRERIAGANLTFYKKEDDDISGMLNLWWLGQESPSNVWIGASAEDQPRADERIPKLREIAAKVRFLSVEPLLEKVALKLPAPLKYTRANDGIHWVIVGGESGPSRRDCGAEAIANAVRQCVDAGVPVFCKQDCAAKPGQKGRLGDDIWARKEFPKL